MLSVLKHYVTKFDFMQLIVNQSGDGRDGGAADSVGRRRGQSGHRTGFCVYDQEQGELKID